MSWLYVPGMVVSRLDCDSLSQRLAQSVWWRGKDSQQRAWSARCKRVGWIRALSHLTLPRSTLARGLESWISSLRGSRVSHGHSPTETDAESRTSDGFGLTLSGSSGSASRGWSSLKMCLGLWQEDLDPYCTDLPEEGTMRDGVVDSPQKPLVPRIAGGVFSCSLPTPTARDYKSGKASQATHDRNSRPLSEVIGGILNPEFVTWMMGLPPGWVALGQASGPESPGSSVPANVKAAAISCDRWETEWCRWWSLMRTALCDLNGPELKRERQL